jgi:TolA-binding protein
MKDRRRGAGIERDTNVRMAFQKPILIVLVLVGMVTVICLAVAVYAWISQPPLTIWVAPPASPATIDQVDSRVRKIEQDYQQLRLKLDYAEKQLDRMQRTIAALVSIAAIYAAAL